MPLDSPAWLAWLRDPANRGFAFRQPHGVITARREARRGVDYWYAYRTVGDRVRKVYLGRAEDLTPERLTGAAATLVLAQNGDHRCFTETDQCIGGRFRQYWEQNGVLAVFGFPITGSRPFGITT